MLGHGVGKRRGPCLPSKPDDQPLWTWPIVSMTISLSGHICGMVLQKKGRLCILTPVWTGSSPSARARLPSDPNPLPWYAIRTFPVAGLPAAGSCPGPLHSSGEPAEGHTRDVQHGGASACFHYPLVRWRRPPLTGPHLNICYHPSVPGPHIPRCGHCCSV